jgi:hypothetical protein
MIDIICLRETYKHHKITQIQWIAGITNPANSITKVKLTTTLKNLIDSNKLNIDIQQ